MLTFAAHWLLYHITYLTLPVSTSGAREADTLIHDCGHEDAQLMPEAKQHDSPTFAFHCSQYDSHWRSSVCNYRPISCLFALLGSTAMQYSPLSLDAQTLLPWTVLVWRYARQNLIRVQASVFEEI